MTGTLMMELRESWKPADLCVLYHIKDKNRRLARSTKSPRWVVENETRMCVFKSSQGGVLKSSKLLSQEVPRYSLVLVIK